MRADCAVGLQIGSDAVAFGIVSEKLASEFLANKLTIFRFQTELKSRYIKFNLMKALTRKNLHLS